ncbi:MAG TPA: hypothetical protein VGR31_01315 [Planctomycetota bacterium]|jgi:capsular polysaccharide biosynthesis protein|nr:hypothetical protein [Planctomycetota bacterium]
MAVQIESRGQLQEFLDVLRRRVWQIAVPAAFVIVIGSCLAVIIPRKFLAKTQLELRQTASSTVSREGQNAKFQIKAPARVRKIIEEELRPPAYQALSETGRRDFLRDIDKNLDVKWETAGQQSSIFITITFTDLDRIWAGQFLKALRDDWKDDVLDQDRRKLEDAKDRLGSERDKLAGQFEAEENKLSDLKKINGISAMQPIPGAATQHGEDPDYERLQANKTEVNRIDVDLAEKRGLIARLNKQLAETPLKIASERVTPGQTHALEIQQTETKIAELKQKILEYKPLNPRYRKIQSDIAALESKRESLDALITGAETSTVLVENPARALLRLQIEDAESKAAALDARRAALATTITEEEKLVDTLHEAYRNVRLSEERIGRFKQDLLEAETRYQVKVQDAEIAKSKVSNPFAILEEINVPNKATEPNPWIIVVFSIVAGLGLGVALAVLLEYTKSCFRSVYDISRVMAAPVLGNINTIVTHRENRQRFARRVLVGSASALVLGSLAFVTWAWAHDQDAGLLSPALRKAIEGFRSVLK